MTRQSLFFALLAALLTQGCLEAGGDHQSREVERSVARAPARVPVPSKKIGFWLADADERVEALEEREAVAGVPLGEAEAEAARLLGRLPDLLKETGDAQEFVMPVRSLPVPRPRITIEGAFPPEEGPPPVEVAPTGPLQVERFAPEGEVSLAPKVSLTFSEPMVPVGSLAALSKEAVPARISPEPEGSWSWLGTRTLVFEPAKRLPMATAYTVSVPAGTKAMSGQALAKEVRWSFTTPPPTLVSSIPRGSSVGLEPVIFAAFDQVIDLEVMFRSVEVLAGVRKIPAQLVTQEVAEENEAVRHAIQRAGAGRWLAFRPTRPLPEASQVQVRITQGARGVEGPLRTTEAQEFGFETFGPLELKETRCGWYYGCEPKMPFTLEFSSELDSSRFNPEMVTVSPEIPELKVELLRNRIVVGGRTKGRTGYTVTVAAGLTDVHGKTLAKPASALVRVGSAPARLARAERDLVVLDPAGPPAYVAHSVNHSTLRAQVYAVTPEDWPGFTAWRNARRYGDGTPPGRLVLDEVIYPKAAPDELAATTVDLSAALDQGLGHAVVHIVATDKPSANRQSEHIVWVQATKLGLYAFLEQDRATAWVTRLADGAPLDDVEVSLLGSSATASTKDGLATLPLTLNDELLVARQGKDSTFLAEGGYRTTAFMSRENRQEPRWFVFDDRGMYLPGEEVHIKGWIRMADLTRGGDLALVHQGALGDRVQYRVRDPRGAELATGEVALSDRGSFDLAFELPANVNLGRARVELELNRSPFRHAHPISIQEFRKPEYEVQTRLSEGPYFNGGQAVATVTASYYAGGGLPDAPVEWTVKQTSTSFTPPHRSDFHFGPAPKGFWWWWRGGEEDEQKETWSAHTDAGGSHRLQLSFDELEPAYPFRLALTSSVEDLNRQRWSGRASMLVHPSGRYVGLRLAKNFVRAGEPLIVDWVVADLDGALIGETPVEVRIARLERSWRGEDYVEEEVGVERCKVERSADTALRCTFRTGEGGRYRVTAVATDEQGWKNQSAIDAWVLGGTGPARQGLDADVVMVIPDKNEYLPGEVATVLVIAPHTPAEGVLSVRRQGVVHLERFSMEEASQTLQVQLDDSMVPNVEIAVDLAGTAPREGADGEVDPSLPRRPAYASGSAQVKILPSTRTLAVQAKPKASQVAPGGRTTIEVEVGDPRGRPARDAEVAVVVVDEAVLSLSGYQTPDPLAFFYRDRAPDVRALQNRTNLILSKPPRETAATQREADVTGGGAGLGVGGLGTRGAEKSKSAGLMAGLGGDASDVFGGGGLGAGVNNALRGLQGADDTPIEARVDFSSIVLFAPRVRTDARGRASVPVKLPDNLTRYRVMAVASAGTNHFGSTEATITARLPLMVRPSAPRFLNHGDSFALSVQLQNQTDAPVDAAVVARATNATIEDAARRVTIPANDRVEVRFPATTLQAGTARFQFGVAAPGFADASQIELPVHTPATTEAFATYGELDVGAIAQPVRLPDAVFTQFGGLEVSTSSTQLQALTDAVLYLASYPFDCSEQVASRVMTIAALRNVLTAFRAEGLPAPEALQASMEEDLARLARTQHLNGGWSFWEGQRETWPYVSVHAAHALVRAKEKGYAPSGLALERAMEYLRRIEAHIPDWYGVDAQRSIEAYALYVRWRGGDADPERAMRLIESAGGVEKLPLEAIGWIWPILSSTRHRLDSGAEVLESIRRHVANRVTETAGAAHFVTSYGDKDWVLLHSNRRTDGVLLEALIYDQPESTLIPKLVKGLLGHRKAGRWRNTQENAFILFALDRYFTKYESTTPDFVARLWLGDRFASEHPFRGRTTDTHELRVPMSWLAANATDTQALVLGKDGPGRLYYRIGMQYAPTDRKLPPLDKGFAVSRTYEGADRPDDVQRDPDGTWRVRLGARVRVRVSMVAPGRRHHVALVDPLPAGFEPLNPALAVTGELPKDPNAENAAQGMGWWRWLWSRTWYEHQNLRDHQAEAFASFLYGGVWDYSYLATATTPGTFVAPPSKAEEMYAPETFGRGAQEWVIVE